MLKSVFGFLSHHLVNDVDQGFRTVLAIRSNVFGFAALVPGQPLRDRPFVKGRFAGQHEIQAATGTVDIRSMIDVVAVHRLFRRKIVGRAQHTFVVHHRQRRVLFLKQGQTQIENLHIAVRSHQQVGRLDVTVYQVIFMSVLQAGHRLNRVINRFVVRQWAVTFDLVVQVLALDVLHDQVVCVSFVANIVDPDNIAMVECRGGSSLTIEPFQVRLVGNPITWQNLDRALLVKDRVLSQINGAHATRAQVPNQFVLAQKEPFVLSRQQLLQMPFGNQLFFQQMLSQLVKLHR